MYWDLKEKKKNCQVSKASICLSVIYRGNILIVTEILDKINRHIKEYFFPFDFTLYKVKKSYGNLNRFFRMLLKTK